MNTTPFYDLRQRLYYIAAAGCQTISEDFRLKKAYEAFEPLSAANKAFAKLYALCGQLFSSDNAPETLADCIALADALAVTQGTFGDNSETEEADFSYDEKLPEGLPYSAVTVLCEKVTKCSPKLEELTADEIKLLSDPRVLSAFMKVCGKGSANINSVAELMYGIYGKGFVTLMKNSVDIYDPKSSGKEVGLTARLAGSEENEWYLSIADNEEAAQNVRLSAIEALGMDKSNAPKLAELYKTQKGKLKNAALDTLVGIDCSEAEEVMAKLLEKYKPSCDSHIAKACGKTATDFAVDIIKRDFGENGLPLKERSVKTPEYAALLSNKPYSDEGFLLMASDLTSGALNCVLINNLRKNNTPEFRELIHRLYSADNSVFFKAEFFSRLIEDSENAVEKLGDAVYEHKTDAMDILSAIYYSTALNKYCLDWRWAGILGRYPILPICDEFPKSLSDLLFSKCGGENEKIRGRAYQNSARTILSLLHNCKKSDFERLRRSAIEYAIEIMTISPGEYLTRIFTEYCSCDDSFDCQGLFTKWVMAAIDNGKDSYPFPVYVMENLPMADSEKTKEMNELLKKLPAMKGKVSDSVLDRQIWYIKEYLARK
ncbi:MAG: HEAT repeat domain-containing protein [Oscillospiraceae bacterium]